MGKKSRKNKSGGANAPPASAAAASAARVPSIDVGSIDNTVCGVCGVYIDPNHWDENENMVAMCCGRSFCSKCSVRQGEEDDAARERLADLTLDSIQNKESLEAQLPLMFEIHRNLNAPCSICGTELAKSKKEHHARILRLAQAGHARSQYILACHYKIGKEQVRKDPELAIEWYKKAAVEGKDSMSCAALGDMYHMGKDVPQSYTEAKKWYELAPNHAIAQDGLGHLYRDGHGVSQNPRKAFEYFRKSAEQGYPCGLFDYGQVLHERGQIEEALIQFEKGAHLEQYLGSYRIPVSQCQLNTALCLAKVNSTEMSSGGDAAKDPFPLILFWARRAVKNGHDGDFLREMETMAHLQCRCCGESKPQSRCSKCRAASYCDKTCQTLAWKAGHKNVCSDLPVLKVYTDEKCAQCGKHKPKFMCQGCSKASYCNAACQKSHWQQEHKDDCRFL